jgi:hypothetical protein
MGKSTLAKVFGWAFFGLTAFGAAVQSNGVPKGTAAWLSLAASLLGAAAIHKASDTDGTR